MNIFLFVLAFGALIVLFVLYAYNALVTGRMRIKEAWSQIDVQLKRRADLIPNLVEVVKGYIKYEKEVLENVTKARTALMGAKDIPEKAKAEQDLTGALKSLFAVAESYPTLKANENFLQLQRELADTEDKVAYSRQFYNTAVLEYNTKLQVFPMMIIANQFHFLPETFFEATAQERAPVPVKLT